MQTLHLAYSAVDGDGISKDVSLLLDEDAEDLAGECLLTVLLPKLEAFLKVCGLIGPHEDLTTTIQ